MNDKYLREIENDLKVRMKAAKRRPVPNAKSQVKSFNASSEPERILDINDPYKVEWTDPAVEGEFIIGQKVRVASYYSHSSCRCDTVHPIATWLMLS